MLWSSNEGVTVYHIVQWKRKCILALKFKGLEGALVTLSPLVTNCATAYG